MVTEVERVMMNRTELACNYFDDPDFVEELAKIGYMYFWHKLHSTDTCVIEQLRVELISRLYGIVESA